MASPCVALMRRLRSPIRPRAGIKKLEMGVRSLAVHLAHLAAPRTHQFHDGADVAVRDVDHEELVRLVIHAANLS